MKEKLQYFSLSLCFSVSLSLPLTFPLSHTLPPLSPTVEFEPINLESLRSQKNFLKATKKQQKELETMRKRHMKERLTIQKGQCSAIEKVAKGKK